jgi:hypothetical protein
MLKPDRGAGRLTCGKAKSLLWKGDTKMSMMPNERTSEWNRIFDRFGRLDGARRQKPAGETAKPLSHPESDRAGEGANDALRQPMPQTRRSRK